MGTTPSRILMILTCIQCNGIWKDLEAYYDECCERDAHCCATTSLFWVHEEGEDL